MSDERTQAERLKDRFPASAHKKVNKGGGDQTYVPAQDVIERLNDVLGVTGWSFRSVREGMTSTEAWVLGEIVAVIDGDAVTRQQYGNEPIVMGRSEKPTADLFKKAGTDALKKCATLIGVALYLYDQDEREEVEAEMRGVFTCEDCKGTIQRAKAKDGSIMMPADIAEIGRNRFQRALCGACYGARIQADARAKQAVGAA